MLSRVALVFLGGGIGAVLRFILYLLVTALTAGVFPFGILLANIIGSFIMGLLAYAFVAWGVQDSNLAAFILVGILGGFTTFSSFSMDTMIFFVADKMLLAFANILVSVILSLVACYLGIVCAKLWLV